MSSIMEDELTIQKKPKFRSKKSKRSEKLKKRLTIQELFKDQLAEEARKQSSQFLTSPFRRVFERDEEKIVQRSMPNSRLKKKVETLMRVFYDNPSSGFSIR